MPNWYRSQKLKDYGKGALLGPLGLALLAPTLKPSQHPSPQVQTETVPAKPLNPTSTPKTNPGTSGPIGDKKPMSGLPNQEKSLADKNPHVRQLLDAGIKLSPFEKDMVVHEGYSSTMYPDSRKIPTIGIGFNLRRPDARAKLKALGLDYDAVMRGATITPQQAVKLMRDDLGVAQNHVNKQFGTQHPQAVNEVLTDMMYNMGPKTFGEFHHVTQAVKAKDYGQAANHMEHSRWYKQVKTRGKDLVQKMRDALPSLKPAAK